MQNLQIIGRAEKTVFPELDGAVVHARIDTGARTSAIWASKIKRKGDRLEVIFWGESSPNYTGKPVIFETFGETVVASSNGVAEHRFTVRILVRLQDKKIRAKFTLANRSEQVYPVLIGRNVLRNKFVVDVSKGDVALETEQKRRHSLRSMLKKDKEKS